MWLTVEAKAYCAAPAATLSAAKACPSAKVEHAPNSPRYGTPKERAVKLLLVIWFSKSPEKCKESSSRPTAE